MPNQLPRTSSSIDTVERILVDEERQLLTDLLSESLDNGTGVDSVTFRARHHKQVRLLDRLETEGLIGKDQHSYVISLPALARMEDEPAQKILVTAEALYAELRSQYLSDPRRPVKILELAAAARTPIGETRRALLYMLESPTWRSGWSSDLDSPDAYVQVSEDVLHYDTFHSLIDQLETWRSSSLHERLRWNEACLADRPADPEHAGRDPVAMSRKPPWFDRLPPELSAIMGEVYAAMDIGLRALTAMGIRAVLDILFVRVLGGDEGTFEQKVTKLCEAKFFNASEREHVLAAINVGNACAHRGHVPDHEDVETILSVCERLLQGHFVLPEATRRLSTNTPPRVKPGRRPS